MVALVAVFGTDVTAKAPIKAPSSAGMRKICDKLGPQCPSTGEPSQPPIHPAIHLFMNPSKPDIILYSIPLLRPGLAEAVNEPTSFRLDASSCLGEVWTPGCSKRSPN